MLCHHCGETLTGGSVFCPRCGARVGRAAAESAGTDGPFFRPAGSLTQETTGKAAPESDKTPDRSYRAPESDAHCPHCGAAVVPGGAFCTACGRRFNAAKPDNARKKKRILLSLGAFAACALLIVGIFLLGKTESPGAEPDAPAISAESREPTAPTAEAVTQSPDFLYGSWYSYSGGMAYPDVGYIVGADVTELHLERTKEATLLYYVTSSDIYYSYTGTWSATVLSENTARITLQLSGGFLGLGDSEEPHNPYNATITVRADGDFLTVTETEDERSPLAGRTLERDLLLEDWVERELSSVVRQITPEQAHSIYETFFCENYSYADRVCLADVTHDGLDEMIVVHFCDEMNARVEGLVYTIDENRQVKLIFTKVGSSCNAGGFFNWYIQESPTGFLLANEDGHWSTGHGSLSYHEYYLTRDGGICEVAYDSVTSLDYSTDEEITAAFDRYKARIAERKASFYTIYSFPQNGYDEDTIALYPTTPSDIFFVEEPDENAIIGHWTYNHELYGPVGVFTFEPDRTGNISIFGNVKYEYTYSVIDDTAFLNIDGKTSVCTFERSGDDLYWYMGGETYYLTWRDE